MARRTGSELEDFYQLDERLWEVRVQLGSPLIGQTLIQSGIGEHLGLAIAAIWRGRQAILAPSPDQSIQASDILLIVGREERVLQLVELGCQIGRESTKGHVNGHISAQGVSFIEVMPAPHSPALGQTLKQLDFRNKHGFTVVALWRGGRSYRTDVGDFNLMLGDALLVVGAHARLKRLQNNSDFIVLEPDISDQPIQRNQAAFTIGIIATGRSDFPNQVNNSLCFPAIFRGTLDVMAKTITDEMCIASARELAKCAEDKGLREDYLLPTMDEWEVFPRQAVAVALKAIEQKVARISLTKEQLYEIASEKIRRARQETQFLMEKGLIPECTL